MAHVRPVSEPSWPIGSRRTLHPDGEVVLPRGDYGAARGRRGRRDARPLGGTVPGRVAVDDVDLAMRVKTYAGFILDSILSGQICI